MSVSLRYGCSVDDNGNFVEATVRAAGHSASDPELVQLGLAFSADDSDTYLYTGGPTLVPAQANATTVRLAGAVQGGQHVFVRGVGQTDARNLTLPRTCSRIEPMDFHLEEPDLFYNHQVTCTSPVGPTLAVKLRNNNDRPVQYTLLLVRGSDGQLSGDQPQGYPLSVPADGSVKQQVVQPINTEDHYQVRAIAPDGVVIFGANVSMHCDSVQYPGPRPTSQPTPVQPTPVPPTTAPSSPSVGSPAPPPAGHRPPTLPVPAPVSGVPATSAAHQLTTARGDSSAGGAGGIGGGSSLVLTADGSANGGSAGSLGGTQPAAGGIASASNGGGPVLGAADSTTQPRKPVTPRPSKGSRSLADPPPVVEMALKPGSAAAALGVLAAFGCALGALLAANRASARRR